MMDFWGSAVAALIGGLISAGIAFGTVREGKRRDEVKATADAKRTAVLRMLDVVDQSLHAQRFPSFMRYWRHSEVDLALVLPRLLIDLPKEEIPMATWVAKQVQVMAWEGSGPTYVGLATLISEKLVGWSRGDVPAKWFEAELEKNPWDPAQKASLSTKVRSTGRSVLTDAIYSTKIMLIVGIIKGGLLPATTDVGQRLVRSISK